MSQPRFLANHDLTEAILLGVFLAHQGDPIAAIIEDLVLIWSASEAEEWGNQVTFLPI